MRFQPWDDFADSIDVTQRPIPVAAPPCPHCVFWRPVTKPALVQRRESRVSLINEGVTLCHADDMQRDFSCYSPRSVEETNDG